ncbi:Zinc finger protein [Plecturocebus cupreus]
MDPGRGRQEGDGDDDGGDDGGGACGREGGGAACTRHACGCRMGSPEMSKDKARTQTQEGEGLGQSDAGCDLARDWGPLQKRWNLTLSYKLECNGTISTHCNLQLLGSSDYSASASQAVGITETGFHPVGQAGLEVLTSGDSPTLVSQSAGLTGVLTLSPRLECSGVTMAYLGLHLSASNDYPTSSGITGSHYFARVGLELMALSDPPASSSQKCWDYRREPPCLATCFFFTWVTDFGSQPIWRRIVTPGGVATQPPEIQGDNVLAEGHTVNRLNAHYHEPCALPG